MTSHLTDDSSVSNIVSAIIVVWIGKVLPDEGVLIGILRPETSAPRLRLVGL